MGESPLLPPALLCAQNAWLHLDTDPECGEQVGLWAWGQRQEAGFVTMKTQLILVWLVTLASVSPSSTDDVTGDRGAPRTQEGLGQAEGKGAENGGEKKVEETQQGLAQEESAGCRAASPAAEGGWQGLCAAAQPGMGRVPEGLVQEVRGTKELGTELATEANKTDNELDTEPAKETDKEPAREPDKESEKESAKEPATESAVKPLGESAKDLDKEPDEEPAKDPTTESAMEPLGESAMEPLGESAMELAQEPANLTTSEPTTAPTTQATTAPTTTPPRCPPSDPWATCGNDALDESHRVAAALTEFSVKLYSSVAKVQGTSSNMVFSPLSVALGLSQLLLGARDETKTRLESILSYPSDLVCVHAPLRQLLKSEAFVSGSQLFFRQGLSLNKAFCKQSEKFYGAVPTSLTGNETLDLHNINKWVSEVTKGKIKKLLKELEPDVQLVLLNAIYLQAKWKTTFKRKNTVQEKFYRPGKDPIEVPMMTSKKYPLAFFNDPSLEAKVGRLQLSHNMSLVIIMPESLSQTLAQVEQKLTKETFSAVMKKLMSSTFKSTVVSLPKFKLDSSQNLMDILGEMDYGIFFYANLCGISEVEDLAVTGAQHRAVLELNEEGVEAAAATAFSVARNAWFFEVHQPFLFVLWNDDHGFPVFMGHVSDPHM
ncbi:plasma protease C1 inhibitor [Carettochelys insculpta]|uniref:plasma protease C1 inhibitor n=1 Tax=Carettochelys insculpta TaxID=44489 RepID=UPI003EC114D7